MNDKKFTILIVDDVPENIQLAANILDKEGYNIAFAPDGKSALSQVKHISADLILLDIMMPETDGFMVCEQLKNDPETADIPIIFLTAMTEKESVVKGFELGGVDYIVKPFNDKELAARVKTHLALKYANEKLRESEQRLIELNATKDKFFSIIAHDLRSPFNALISGTQFLKDCYSSLEKDTLDMVIDELHSSSKNVFVLLENLLEWAKSQSGNISYDPEALNLCALIKIVISVFTKNIKDKNIRIVNTVDPNLSVYADMDMIGTVLRNLCGNAVKFTTDGGSICFTSSDKGKFIEITVSDTGTGIPAEDIDKLFRIDTKYSKIGTAGEKGTGLGLILCKEFVGKNGGTIRIESVYGKGSRFIFTLPKDKI